MAYAAWFAAFQLVGRYATRLPTRDPTTALDRAVPFAPGWVWVYELCYLLPFAPLWLVRERSRLARALLAVVLANVTAFAVYLALPLAWPLPPPGEGLSARVLALERAADFQPGANKLPSMHVAFAWLTALACLGQGRPLAGAALVLAAAAVSASTVLLRQHVLLDVAFGAAWALAAWWASGLLLRRVTGEARSPREAFRRVAWRAGAPALIATAALVAARAIARRWLAW